MKPPLQDLENLWQWFAVQQLDITQLFHLSFILPAGGCLMNASRRRKVAFVIEYLEIILYV